MDTQCFIKFSLDCKRLLSVSGDVSVTPISLVIS